MEEAFVLLWKEALRKLPSVVFFPHIDQWWLQAPSTLRHTFIGCVRELSPTTPVLIFATSETSMQKLPPEMRFIFPSKALEPQPNDLLSQNPKTEIDEEFFLSDTQRTQEKATTSLPGTFIISSPSQQAKEDFFMHLLNECSKCPEEIPATADLPELPKAPIASLEPPTEEVLRAKELSE